MHATKIHILEHGDECSTLADSPGVHRASLLSPSFYSKIERAEEAKRYTGELREGNVICIKYSCTRN
jgi:hypothetical protein